MAPGACGVSGGLVPGVDMTSAPGPRLTRTEGAQELVGMGGVEPPRPFGHTDLNRARLPFRHIPWRTRTVAARGGCPAGGYRTGRRPGGRPVTHERHGVADSRV